MILDEKIRGIFMRILILGDTGLIGQGLVNHFKSNHEVIGLSRRCVKGDYEHIQYDVEDDIQEILLKKSPDLIISCTRGDFDAQLRCHESIVSYALKNQTKVFFYSTANVFDGEGDAVKIESDDPFASSDYGIFKMKVESMIGSLDEGVVIRLPMVLSESSPRMDMLKTTKQHSKILDVPDPVYISLVTVDQIVKMQEYLLVNKLKGIFHFTTNDQMTLKEVYSFLIGNDEYLNVKIIEPIYLALKSERSDWPFDFKMKDIIEELKL